MITHNSMHQKSISRRTLLRGLGTVLALPWLEKMGEVSGWAAGQSPGKTAPNRMAFVYVPNGKEMANWTPKGGGDELKLSEILQPLEGHQKDLLVLTGLAADKARGSRAGDVGVFDRGATAEDGWSGHSLWGFGRSVGGGPDCGANALGFVGAGV